MASDSFAINPAGVATRSIGEKLHDWVVTVDHKKLGILYIVYALIFLVIGGIEATMMRIQLMVPNNHFVSPEVFNRLFTLHGTTMIFFVAMPILFGFGTYLIPLMIGTRDMAFPRLNALSLWLTAFGGSTFVFQLDRRKWTLRRRQCAGRGMVRLCPAYVAPVLARSQHRFLDTGPPRIRHRQYWGGREFHHYDPLHALPRDDSRKDAPTGYG